MKTNRSEIRLAAVLLTCTVTCSLALAGWSVLCPQPTGNDLFAVQHVMAGTWLVSGAGGTVLKTTDDGATWTERGQPGGLLEFFRVRFPADTLTGFVLGRSDAGSQQSVLRTTDGGRGWSTVLPNTLCHLVDIWFSSDAGTGLAVGYDRGIPDTMVVYRTVDSGASWTPSSPHMTGRLYAVCFPADDRTGYAVGNQEPAGGVVLKTTDAGVSWSRVAGPVGTSLTRVSFPEDGNVGYAIGAYGVVLKTTDAGASWDSSGFQSGWVPIDLCFRDNQSGFALMGNYDHGAQTRHRTTDGGATWSEDTTASFYPTALDFAPDRERVLMTGLFGDLKLSTDAGQTWSDLTRRATRHHLKGLSFPTDPARGYAVGDFGSVSATDDYGRHWTARGTFDSTCTFTDVAFPVGPETGFVSGWRPANRGFVYRTTNEGATWDSVLGRSSASFSDLSFPTAETGYARAGNLVYRTTDAGNTWSAHHTGTSATYLDMDFCCADTGVLVGDWGAVARTVDAGQSWSAVNTGITERLYAVCVLPGGLDIHVCGNDRYFARSTDGGETWQGDYIGSSSDCLYDITFPAGADTGYVAGGGGIFRTTDQGATWSMEFSTSALLLAISFPSDCSRGYAVGTNGIVVSTVDATGVAESQRSQSAGPIRNATIARTVLHVPGSDVERAAPNVLLDISGRKVLDLHPGPNDVSRLAPGVYFVREQPQAASSKPQAVRKVVIQR